MDFHKFDILQCCCTQQGGESCFEVRNVEFHALKARFSIFADFVGVESEDLSMHRTRSRTQHLTNYVSPHTTSAHCYSSSFLTGWAIPVLDDSGNSLGYRQLYEHPQTKTSGTHCTPTNLGVSAKALIMVLTTKTSAIPILTPYSSYNMTTSTPP